MTGKRRYRLGKRQASVDATRRRIIDAAVLEYLDNGIPGTSMQAVARRADVAPGTVLYHYSDPDDLADAVFGSWTRDFSMPTPDLIESDQPLAERIATLVSELFGLYERSEVGYQIYLKSPDHPAIRRWEGIWNENVRQMISRALGDSTGELETFQVVSALVNPGFRGTLIESGLTSQRAVEVTTEVTIEWLSR